MNGQIQTGPFAYALRLGTPVFYLPGDDAVAGRGVLHSLAISSQIVDMFCVTR